MTKTHTSAKSSTSDSDFALLPPRERILVAARTLFYARGIHIVGVEAIAEAALTNKMTLYRHFKSKDELIVAYVRLLSAEGDASWDQIATACPADPQKQIAGWIAYVEECLASKMERGCALANAAVELPPSHPARGVIDAYKQDKRERLVQLFAQADYPNPNGLADEVFLLFEGANISQQCGGKDLATRVVAMLRELVRPR